MPFITMRVQNYQEVVRKLSTDYLLADAWRSGLSRAVALVKAQAQTNAPAASGDLKGSITGSLAPGAVPLWGKVTTDQTGRNGYRYPWALESSARYHYAGGRRKKRGGRQTKGWFIKALKSKRKDIEDILSGVAKAVERRWAG